MQFNEIKSSVADRTRKTNFEGGEAYEPDTPELSLYKVVINNLLEDKFYEDDESSFEKVVDRFEDCAEANPEFVLKLAYYAREEMYLRQVPQLLLVLAANHEDTKPYVRDYAEGVMQRADEPLEALAMQVKLFGKSIPNPLQKGFEDTLHNFDEYQFAKWDSDNREFSYRDFMALVHPSPQDDERDEIFERIVRGPLDDYPDVEPLKQHRTWENTLSDDSDDRSKAEKYRARLEDMHIMAKIRNVRNMLEAGLQPNEVLTESDLEAVPKVKVYPFRYYQAYKALKPETTRFGRTRGKDLSNRYLDEWFEQAIDKSVEHVPEEFGDTFVSVDTSGSMQMSLSDNSSINYDEIASLFGAICAKKGASVSAFASSFEEFNLHSGTPALQIQERVLKSSIGGGTNGHLPVEHLVNEGREYQNVVLFTDLQLWDSGRGRHNSLKEAWDEYTREVNPDASLYVVDLSSYGDLVTPEGYENVYNISGWTSNIVDHVQYASDEDAVIREVEDVQPVK